MLFLQKYDNISEISSTYYSECIHEDLALLYKKSTALLTFFPENPYNIFKISSSSR